MTEKQGLNLVGRNVREARLQLTLPRSEVVDRASGAISQATLARWERGNAVRLGTIFVIAEVLGGRPEILFDFR